MTTNPFKKLLSDRQIDPQPEEIEIKITPPSEPIKNQRGRPATGKRSDPDWIGRTYYIKKATDINVEVALAELRRDGIELDKSELVDCLLDVWVKWQQGENTDLQLADISPRRKYK